jgi:hypothetical protein
MPINFIKETLRYRNESNAWQSKYDAHAPKAGDVAPDFDLFDVTGAHRIKLSDFKGKRPVALMFGSFT